MTLVFLKFTVSINSSPIQMARVFGPCLSFPTVATPPIPSHHSEYFHHHGFFIWVIHPHCLPYSFKSWDCLEMLRQKDSRIGKGLRKIQKLEYIFTLTSLKNTYFVAIRRKICISACIHSNIFWYNLPRSFVSQSTTTQEPYHCYYYTCLPHF